MVAEWTTGHACTNMDDFSYTICPLCALALFYMSHREYESTAVPYSAFRLLFFKLCLFSFITVTNLCTAPE